MQGRGNGSQSDSSSVKFKYDAAGNRIAKITDGDSTVYVRDASGNVMAVYKNDTLIEQSIYGSNRLGLHLQDAKPGYRTLGHKTYELSNHLGNVLTTVRDRIQLSQDSTWAETVSISDYYPFGLTMAGRSVSDSTYRYGFNGKENDNSGEWGSKNHYDYGFRIYNPGIGKFLSVDPLTKSYPMLTPYQFASNSPIANIDIDGLEGQYAGWQDFHRLNMTALKGGDVKSVSAEIQRKNKINTAIAFGSVLMPIAGITAVETMPVWLPWAYSTGTGGILAGGKYGPEVVGLAAGALGYDGEIPGTSGDELGKLINKGLKLGGAYGRMKNFYSSLGELITNKNHLPTLKSYELSGFKVSSYMGSANIMSIQDHKDFISTGGKEVAKMFRQAEANLLREGKYLDAFDLNANAIRDQFGDVYNEGLENARDHFIKEVIPILEEQSKKNKQ